SITAPLFCYYHAGRDNVRRSINDPWHHSYYRLLFIFWCCGSWIDMGVLENSVRDDLNVHAPRAMGVLNPLKIVITNYPEDQEEEMVAQNHPQNSDMGTRTVPFSRELYIERSDYLENAPRKFFRFTEGREVRLRYAYLVTCQEAIKDKNGEVVELRCTYDPETKGGSAPDGRKVKGTIHWVSAKHGIPAEVRLYDRLFSVENPDSDKEKNFKNFLNPDSCQIVENSILEPSLAELGQEDRVQFERQGYFCLDSKESSPKKPVFNRIVTLRDSWAKMQKKR
ncbi:MAG: hypothetical protein D3919_09420, partial [Candidatus Electrothrix sp. AW5]|nr:hypothetical protein [Candidatus Electrothrix gigas]